MEYRKEGFGGQYGQFHGRFSAIERVKNAEIDGQNVLQLEFHSRINGRKRLVLQNVGLAENDIVIH